MHSGILDQNFLRRPESEAAGAAGGLRRWSEVHCGRRRSWECRRGGATFQRSSSKDGIPAGTLLMMKVFSSYECVYFFVSSNVIVLDLKTFLLLVYFVSFFYFYFMSLMTEVSSFGDEDVQTGSQIKK